MTTAASLPQPIRKRVNRLAHLLGTLHAEQQKHVLEARLQAMRARGAGFDELAAELDRMESRGADPHGKRIAPVKPHGFSRAESFPPHSAKR